MVTMALCVNIHCNVQVGWVQMLCRQFIHNIESTECRVEERHGKDVHWILNQQKSYEIKENQSKSNEKNHLADAYPYILYFCFQASLQSTTHYSDLSWAWWVFMCEEFRYVLVVTFAWQFTVVLLCLVEWWRKHFVFGCWVWHTLVVEEDCIWDWTKQSSYNFCNGSGKIWLVGYFPFTIGFQFKLRLQVHFTTVA